MSVRKKSGQIVEPPVDPLVMRLNDLNAGFRYTMQAPTCKRVVHGVPEMEGDFTFQCQVMDRDTGEWYANGKGASKIEALEKAVAAAEESEKPLTHAQKNDPRVAKQKEEAAEMQKRLREQDAELQKLRAEAKNKKNIANAVLGG